MRVVVTLDGVELEFVEPHVSAMYPWLADMSEVTLEARAGHLESVGTRESANCTFSLDNTSRQAATLLGRPVRAAAVAYDDDGNELLSGLLQEVQYGTLLIGTIEA